ACEPRLEIAQLAFGAPASKLPAFQRGDAGGIVASVFEPLERVDQRGRDRLTPEYAHNSAHASDCLLGRWRGSCPEHHVSAVNADKENQNTSQAVTIKPNVRIARPHLAGRSEE